MRYVAALVAAAAILVAAPVVAFAQAPLLASPSTIVDINGIIQMVLGTVATIVIGLFANWYRLRTGKELEAKNRDAYQTALTNVAGDVWQIIQGKTAPVPTPGVPAAPQAPPVVTANMPEVQRAAEKVIILKAPDAVKAFGLSKQAIAEAIVEKIGVAKMLGQAGPVGAIVGGVLRGMAGKQ